MSAHPRVGSSPVESVISFIEGAIQAGFVTREQVKRLYAGGWLPCLRWTRGVELATTKDALAQCEQKGKTR